jgi:hypothetical protein
MSKVRVGWARASFVGMMVGAGAVITVSLGVGLADCSPAVAASHGSTSTTVGIVPQSVRTHTKEAQADLTQIDSAVADLTAQDKTAASDLATLEKDVKTLDRAPASASGPAGADEVSAAIARLFVTHAQQYQALAAQAEAVHQQFVNALNAAAGAYAHTEAAQAESHAANP